MGSDVVAATCIVAGGILGGLGWRSMEVQDAPAPAGPECAGVAVTAVSAPDVVVRLEDGVRVVIAPRTPVGADVRIACGSPDASVAELRSRTRAARVRVLDIRGERHEPATGGVRLRSAPELPR